MPATDLQLDGLRAFAAVVDAGSLSAALIPRVRRGEIDLAIVSRLVRPARPRHAAVPRAARLRRRDALAALSAQRRAWRVVYNSSSLAGQLAAVDSGLAVAVLRSRASRGVAAVDALHAQMLATLQAAALRRATQ